jgi:hypothetical protein
MTKKNVMHWGTLKYVLQQVTKKFIQKIHLHVKVFFEKKTCHPFPEQSFWLLIIGFDLQVSSSFKVSLYFFPLFFFFFLVLFD